MFHSPAVVVPALDSGGAGGAGRAGLGSGLRGWAHTGAGGSHRRGAGRGWREWLTSLPHRRTESAYPLCGHQRAYAFCSIHVGAYLLLLPARVPLHAVREQVLSTTRFKPARTIADLARPDQTAAPQIAEALQHRLWAERMTAQGGEDDRANRM